MISNAGLNKYCLEEEPAGPVSHAALVPPSHDFLSLHTLTGATLQGPSGWVGGDDAGRVVRVQ